MRTCGMRCWWAKSGWNKCKCKCGGRQHGILRNENKERFEAWVEEQYKVFKKKFFPEENRLDEEGEQQAEVWRMRQYIREVEAREVEI